MREAVDRTALLRVQAHLQLRIEPVALFFGVAADAFALLFAVCGSLAELCALLLRCRKDALAPLGRAGSESVSQLLALLLQQHRVLGKDRMCAEKPLHRHDKV